MSNLKININGANLILDMDFWKAIDPDWKHGALYNVNWIKQQLFKLNVDRYVNGNVLIVDAEVLFLKPTRWIENNKINYYTSFSPKHQPYFNLSKAAALVDQLSPYSFITDTMVFSTEILQSLRRDIEIIHQQSYLKVFETLIIGTNEYNLSEFELYGNYVLKKYSDIVNNMFDPIYHVIDIVNDRQSYSFDDLLDLVRQKTKNNFISVNISTRSYSLNSVTSWLGFYDQIKDPTWPDCEKEENFVNLPDHIKKECMEVFGYEPKFNT
jgi:hypothetical protein